MCRLYVPASIMSFKRCVPARLQMMRNKAKCRHYAADRAMGLRIAVLYIWA